MHLCPLTPRDVVAVIGTSGVVLPVTHMAEQFPGCKILNNLAPEAAIDDSVFDEVFYEPARGGEGIDAFLVQRLGAQDKS